MTRCPERNHREAQPPHRRHRPVAGFSLVTAHAAANEQPVWDVVDPNLAGSLSLFDATGTEITSGSVNTPIAAYAVGGAVLHAGDNAAALFAHTPVAGTSPAGWTGVQLTGTTASPVSGAPAALPSGPTAAITSSSITLAQYSAAYPSASGVYELRLRSTAPGHTTASYDAVAVEIEGSTWTVTDGIGSEVTATTTALTASSSPRAGGPVTLTATVSPAEATGAVQFKDGAKSLGAPVPVTSGVATLTTRITTAGTHAFSATFTPTAGFSGSNGSLSVSAAKATATLKVSASPNPVKITKKAKVSVTVTTPGLIAGGKVQVVEGKKVLGSATLKAGKATITLPKLAKGNHSLKVTYAGTSDIASKTATVILKAVK